VQTKVEGLSEEIMLKRRVPLPTKLLMVIDRIL
jgi:hypothetical protein